MMNNMNNNDSLIKEKNLDDNLYDDYQEYFIIKDKKDPKIFKIIILKRKEDIIIKSGKYKIHLNLFNFYHLTKSSFDILDKAYDYLTDLFEENKVSIKEKSTNNHIKLKFKENKKKEFELTLSYNKLNKNIILNELNNQYEDLKEEINNLRNEINSLTKEIENIKNPSKEAKKRHKKSVEYKSNAKKIREPNYIVKNITTKFMAGNAICVFRSIINNMLYLIYPNKNNSIISYDLVDNKIIKEIKNAHSNNDIRFRHNLDIINKRDLLLSISIEENELKLWNVNNWECILHIPKVNEVGKIFSACLLNDYDATYIITTNHDIHVEPEFIKVFDLEGNKITEINDSSNQTYFIDKYYDDNLSKYYLLTANVGGVKSYDYYKNKLYHKYSDIENKSSYDFHNSLIINDCEEIIKLIESCDDKYIRIWNFHTAQLIKRLKADNSLNGLCLWNNNFLFSGCRDHTIKLFDLSKGTISNELKGHDSELTTIIKTFHPKYGECLVSIDTKGIILWNYKA